jgi:DNA ligase D-like protein (predicted 3'-phosphoesterase)
MSLKEYKQKRKFENTAEPEGSIKSTGKNIFVVQKHDASRLHYDFRIEFKGILKSWAVPKGPSTNPSQRRLAIETEDHPIEYADFEGTIPEGEYGAGTVIIWDFGTYENITEKNNAPVSLEYAYNNGHITLSLKGTRLKGGYALIKMKRKGQWLLIKTDDPHADRSVAITDKYTTSITSHKSLDELETE